MIGFKDNISGNISTATILQTARTINGTSFNGSANITTANWGTARTITIGSTGKSVNGSGNVSWTLSEIGAAASSHTHSYLPLSGGTLTGETIFNNFLSINAWSGYGSGKAQMWYNGTTKSLLLQPPVEDIQINGQYVYHQGRLPNNFDLGGINTISSTANDTPNNWSAWKNSVHFYNVAECLKYQPNQYGYLLNIGGNQNDVHQLWFTQSTGDLLHRGGNGAGWHGAANGDGSWRTILDSSNIYDHSSNLSVRWAQISQEMYFNEKGECWVGQGTGDGASYSTHNFKIKSWWGIGFYDHNEWCNMIMDTRNGNFTVKGYMSAASWQTTSDRRLKENITPLDKKLENMFMELKPVNYYMIEEKDKRRHNGFIAQEIEEAMKNNGISYEEFAGLHKKNHKEEKTPLNELDIPIQILSDENDEENVEYSLNYNEFTALNTHMIQKCLNIINEQSNKIEKLENRVQELEALL